MAENKKISNLNSELITVGSASNWDPGTKPTIKSDTVCKIESWEPGEHTANIQATVLTKMEVKNGILVISTGNQSHTYTAPDLAYYNKDITGTIKDTWVSPSLVITQVAVATE